MTISINQDQDFLNGKNDILEMEMSKLGGFCEITNSTLRDLEVGKSPKSASAEQLNSKENYREL